MPAIGNNPDALYQGLGSFWVKLFQDTGDLQALYRGSSQLLGQAYIDLLNVTLGSSLIDTPLFDKNYFKAYTIRSDKFTYVDNGVIGQARYYYAVDDYLGAAPQLQNKVFEPTAALEAGIDYTVVNGMLAFGSNPTLPVVDGFGWRPVDVAVAGSFLDTDWTVVGAQPGDTLTVNGKFPVTGTETGSVQLRICAVTRDHLTIDATTPIPSRLVAGYAWAVTRTLTTGAVITLGSNSALTGTFDTNTVYTATELSVWAVDALVDQQTLYRNYGYLLNHPAQPSTESYRAFIRGIMQLYLFGPAMGRIVGALNLVAGYPLAAKDGEILEGYDAGVNFQFSDGALVGSVFSSASATWSQSDVGGYITIRASAFPGNIKTFRITAVTSTTTVTLLPPDTGFTNDTGMSYRYSFTDKQTVTTDVDTYSFPIDIPMRSDVMDPTKYGILTFRLFEAFTAAIKVTDYIEDPSWWHRITIPESLAPGWSPTERVVTPELYPNVFDATNGNLRFDDPGFFFDKDSAGNPSDGVHPQYHHSAAFIMMDKLLKLHMFKVDIDRNVDLSGTLSSEMADLLQEVKPSHTYIYFQSNSSFADALHFADTLTFQLIYTFWDSIPVFDNLLRFDGTWNFSDTWHFTNPTGGAVTVDGTSTNTPFYFNGQNPNLLPGAGVVTLVDRPLRIYSHS